MPRAGAFAADIFVVVLLVVTIVNFFVLSQNPDAVQALEEYTEEVREHQESNDTDEALEPPPPPPEAVERLVRSIYITILLTLLIYFAAAELLTKGASPGKLLFKLQVVRTDAGETLATSATVVRSVIKAVTLALAILHPLLLVFVFNYLFAFFTQERRAGHDYIARTRVIAKPSTSFYGQAPSQDPVP